MSYQPLTTASSELNLSTASTLKTKARSLGLSNEAELERKWNRWLFILDNLHQKSISVQPIVTNGFNYSKSINYTVDRFAMSDHDDDDDDDDESVLHTRL